MSDEQEQELRAIIAEEVKKALNEHRHHRPGDRVRYVVEGTIGDIDDDGYATLKDISVNSMPSSHDGFSGEVDWVKLAYLRKVE